MSFSRAANWPPATPAAPTRTSILAQVRHYAELHSRLGRVSAPAGMDIRSAIGRQYAFLEEMLEAAGVPE